MDLYLTGLRALGQRLSASVLSIRKCSSWAFCSIAFNCVCEVFDRFSSQKQSS